MLTDLLDKYFKREQTKEEMWKVLENIDPKMFEKLKKAGSPFVK
tara:strand:- start:247 stop:378 length:132 start_codon:yes stop_codon:yes gene_type:complete